MYIYIYMNNDDNNNNNDNNNNMCSLHRCIQLLI